MRYYNLKFEIVKGKAICNLAFIVPEKKLSNYTDKKNNLLLLDGNLNYSSINENYKNATLDRIEFSSFDVNKLDQLNEFRNQVNYLKKKLENNNKTITRLKDVVEYVKNNEKFKRVVYDPREQAFLPIKDLKPDDFHRYNAYTDNDDYVLSIVSNKPYKEAKKELLHKAKKEKQNSTYKKEKEMLENFIEEGYVQRVIKYHKPNIKKLW